jgi:hypothetical protein
MMLACNERGWVTVELTVKWLRGVWNRRPGAFVKKRGILVVENDYVTCTGNGCCLTCPLTAVGNIRRPSDTVLGWNDSSSPVVVGFKKCRISNGMNALWKTKKKTILFVIKHWQ